MKISSYTIVYSGLSAEPYYAAAMKNGKNIWSVASGNEEGGAQIVIQEFEDLDRKNSSKDPEDVKAMFARLHPELRKKKLMVSSAGVLSDDNTIQMFNIGSARCYFFADGYLTAHTDDHTEAYEAYQALRDESASAYDAIRFQKNRLILQKALGLHDDSEPQFYPSVSLQNNDAFLICTERFWHYISTIEMELDYRKAAGAEEWLKTMCKRVLMKANRELDEGNFAAIAAMVEA